MIWRAMSGKVSAVTSIVPKRSSHKIFSHMVQYAALNLRRIMVNEGDKNLRRASKTHPACFAAVTSQLCAAANHFSSSPKRSRTI